MNKFILNILTVVSLLSAGYVNADMLNSDTEKAAQSYENTAEGKNLAPYLQQIVSHMASLHNILDELKEMIASNIYYHTNDSSWLSSYEQVLNDIDKINKYLATLQHFGDQLINKTRKGKRMSHWQAMKSAEIEISSILYGSFYSSFKKITTDDEIKVCWNKAVFSSQELHSYLEKVNRIVRNHLEQLATKSDTTGIKYEDKSMYSEHIIDLISKISKVTAYIGVKYIK